MNLKIILCRPQLSKNIGSVARVMLNFGFEHLALISPKENWLDDQAIAIAAGAEKLLKQAKVYKNLSEALVDVHEVYAFSARSRHLNKENMELKEVPASIEGNKNAALLFGPESSGLSNEDLILANKIVQIPTNPDFSSLNLAQSVAISLYEIAKSKFNNTEPVKDSEIASIYEINLFLEQLERELLDSSFLRVVEKRSDMLKNIKNIFMRINNLSSQEVRTLRGIVTALASK